MVSLVDGGLPRARLRFGDVLAVNDLAALLEVALLGPAFWLLSGAVDYERTSQRAGFEIGLHVRGSRVVLRTRETDQHLRNADGSNVEAINVYHAPKARPRAR